MATHDEFQAEARTQYQKLNEEWRRLYTVGSQDGLAALYVDDLKHSPPALRQFVQDVVTEILDVADKHLEEVIDEGDVEAHSSAAVEFLLTHITSDAAVLATRMFQMGYTLREEVPFDRLIPCPCKAITDDDFNKLLGSGFDLEGEGFVIKNFDSSKAQLMKGKAHWLPKEV